MTTGMFDPIIRPIGKAKPSSPSSPEQVAVVYDHAYGRLQATHLRTGEKTAPSSIVLHDVECHITDGYRDGCGETGKLGSLVGTPAQEVTLDPSQMKRIRWGGDTFVDDKHRRVCSAKMVMVVGGSMLALDPITD